MNKLKFLIFLLISFVLIIVGQATTDLNQSQGFSPNTRFYSSGGDENINIMNGNLMLNYVDASLPGRNGMSPGVGRIYNSKIWETCEFEETTDHLQKRKTIGRIGEFGVGWSLAIPRIKLNNVPKRTLTCECTDDNITYPDSSDISFTSSDGGGHQFENLHLKEKDGVLYYTGYTVDSTYFNIEFKKDDFEIKENNDIRMIFPRQTYLYFPKNDESKISIYTKDGTMFEAFPNRKQTLYDTPSITVENYSDWTDTEVEVLQAAVASCYYYESIISKKNVDFKVLKVEDVNGNYYNINYNSSNITGIKELIIDTDLDLPKFPYIPRSSSEFNKLLEKILSNIKIRDVEEIPEDYTIQTETTTDNDGLIIYYIPFVKFLKYDTITDMTDSNGYKINFTWTSLPFDDKEINVITGINYKNSEGEVIEVEYSYSHQYIDFPATSPVRYSGNKSVYLLESIVYRKSGEQDPLINAFNFEYNDQGFIRTVKYPIRDDTNGNKKGIIEYEYETYKYISELNIAAHVHSEVGDVGIQDATYGVVTRIEEGDKVTKYSRGISPGLIGNIIMGFPKQVYVIQPDNTYEKHNYIIEGYRVLSTTFIYINSWRAGHEESVEYYSAWESGDDKLLQKVEYDWCARQKINCFDISYAAKNIRLRKKTIKKYNQDDSSLFKTYEIEYTKYDDWGNITRMVNRRDIEDPTDDIIIVNYYLHTLDANYRWKNILDKVKLTIVKDKDGNILKKTRFKYDQFIPKNYGIDTDQKYKTVNLNPSKLGETYRGNLTTSITYIAEQDEEGKFNWDNAIEVKRHFTYDIFGNQVTSEDPNGNTSKVTYDETYNYTLPVEVFNALNHKAEISYYPNTYLVKTSTDINGNNVSNEYDSLDRLVKIIYPKTAGNFTEYEYHDEVFPAYTVVRNNIEAETFSESVYYYDGMGRFIYGGVKEDVKGGIDSWVVNGVDYDCMGRTEYAYEPQKFSFNDPMDCPDPRKENVSYIRSEYDSLGRVKTRWIPDGELGTNSMIPIRYKYDDYINSIMIYDAKNHGTRYLYDSHDKLHRVVEFDENNEVYSRTNFEYNLLGNMTVMRTSKDGVNWMVSEYTYDSEGRLFKSKIPDSGENYFQYDEVGNLIQKKDANNHMIQYKYDKLNRLTKIIYPDGSYIENTYDNTGINNGIGKLYSKSKYDSYGALLSKNTYKDFDDTGRLLEKEEYLDYNFDSPLMINHFYSFNKVGFLMDYSISLNGQEIQKMECNYDLMGRADELYETLMSSPATRTQVAQIPEFSALGMVEEINYQNGVTVNYSFNPYRNWTEGMTIFRNGNPFFINKYEYDVLGNRTKLTDEHGITTTYEYDSLSRLTAVNGKYYNKNGEDDGSKYEYDNVGNRKTYQSKYHEIHYEYNTKSNKLNKVDFKRNNNEDQYILMFYDNNGNTIQRDYFRGLDEIYEQELYEYDFENMLTNYVRHRPEIINNRIELIIESELNMYYNVNGMRVIKECYPNTGDSTVYIYNGSEVVLEMTYDQIPKLKRIFTYAGLKKVSCTKFNENEKIKLDSRIYFHQNYLGSIAIITDETGKIIEHNKFDSFGEIIWSKTYDDVDNNYKFTGKERDKESQLDYFNARYLDAKLGRFMKPDMLRGDIMNPQTINKWVYCVNNPIKFIDPTGMFAARRHIGISLSVKAPSYKPPGTVDMDNPLLGRLANIKTHHEPIFKLKLELGEVEAWLEIRNPMVATTVWRSEDMYWVSGKNETFGGLAEKMRDRNKNVTDESIMRANPSLSFCGENTKIPFKMIYYQPDLKYITPLRYAEGYIIYEGKEFYGETKVDFYDRWAIFKVSGSTMFEVYGVSYYTSTIKGVRVMEDYTGNAKGYCLSLIYVGGIIYSDNGQVTEKYKGIEFVGDRTIFSNIAIPVSTFEVNTKFSHWQWK